MYHKQYAIAYFWCLRLAVEDLWKNVTVAEDAADVRLEFLFGEESSPLISERFYLDWFPSEEV